MSVSSTGRGSGPGPEGRQVDFAARLRRRLAELRPEGDVPAGGTGESPGLEAEFAELAESYLRLDERLAKIITIGDKYQAEVLETKGRLKDALEQLEAIKAAECREKPPRAPSAGAVGQKTGTPPRRDPLAERLKSAMAAGGPLSPADVETLLKRCEKLNGRIDKIVAISDRYQSQLREISMRMDYMARTDPLTGLSNRRDMIERLDRETARFGRYGTVFSLILFDIDDFKRVNDSFGHDSGDRVLKGVADIFLGEIRRTDGCSRWGGEEFLLLCPETGLAEARIVGEKCRQAVARLRVETKDGEVGVTLSGGVVSMAEGLDRDGLIKLADEGLYAAKAAGKNRLV